MQLYDTMRRCAALCNSATQVNRSGPSSLSNNLSFTQSCLYKLTPIPIFQLTPKRTYLQYTPMVAHSNTTQSITHSIQYL